MPGQSREKTRRAGSEGAKEFFVRLDGRGHRRVCIAVGRKDGDRGEDGDDFVREGDYMIRLTSSDLW